MDNNIKPFSSGVKEINIASEVRDSFLEYAMSVNISRAIPDVRDGLKPVHRRIIYAMNELGMHYNKGYKKSARIVGDVIGKYHPHGDASVYDALVRLAQDFSYRYPLIDGHGNFGSIDDDPPAAMRYTEAKMARLAMEMVSDLNKNTVNFGPNYDGEELEPLVLPARFPNLLVNGTLGIAVGMATSIPTHNMGEVIDALLAVMENPEIEIIDLMNNYIPGPDFPTGGIIMGRAGIKKAYLTGNGSLRIRSRHVIEEKDGRKRIIITQIPYALSKVNLVKKIADLVKDKIVDGISDLRDESNREGIRIIIELKKDCIPEVLLNHLYSLTPLQTTFSINMLALVKGEPKVLNLKEILKHYIDHQVEVIFRRSKFELGKAKEREHVVQGLKIAVDNVDEIIKIIRASENIDIATQTLINRFNLSDKQAKVILDMQFRRLAAIERQKIEEELLTLATTIKELESLINDNNKILEVIKKDLGDIRARYGDSRRSEISNEDYDIDDEDLIPVEDIVVSLTTNGYVKRITLDTYRTQNRGGRGIKGVSTYEDDIVDKLLTLSTHSDILFFSNFGKVYRLRGYQVPEFGRSAKGIPIVNLLKLDKDELIKSMISLKEYNENQTLLFVSVRGIVKRVDLKQFENIRQNGKIAFGLRDGDELFDVKLTDGNSEIIIGSSYGKAVRIVEESIKRLGRTAVGVKSINLSDDEDKVVGVALSMEGSKILAISENGYGKCSELEDYRLTNRRAKGVKTLNVTDKVGPLVALKAINGNEELLITTTKGIIIRVSVEQIRVAGRNTQGVRIIRLLENQKVASVTVIDASQEMIEDSEVIPIEDLEQEVLLEEEKE